MKRIIIVGSMFAAAVSTGCIMERGYDRQLPENVVVDRSGNVLTENDPGTPNVNEPISDRIRGAINGRIVGDVGPAEGIDQGTNVLNVYDDGYYTSIEAVVDLESRAAMVLLSITNGGDLLVPGLDETFRFDNYDPNAVQVSALGCVGQDVGVYDEYDQPADEVDLVGEEGENPGEVVIQMTSRWHERDQNGNPTSRNTEAITSFTLTR